MHGKCCHDSGSLAAVVHSQHANDVRARHVPERNKRGVSCGATSLVQGARWRVVHVCKNGSHRTHRRGRRGKDMFRYCTPFPHYLNTMATTSALEMAESVIMRVCPWCGVSALKDTACNWVRCGDFNDPEKGLVGVSHRWGCKRQWCFECERKLCDRSESHTATCCEEECGSRAVFLAEYCMGGHNSHCPKRG